MKAWPNHGHIDGAIVMIGFGSIGKGTLPLIERHFTFDRQHLVVIDPNDADRKILDDAGIKCLHLAITKDNYRDVLPPLLTAGKGQGFCVTLSVDTSSLAIMELAREVGADLLLVLTNVPRACLGYGTPAQKELGTVRRSEMQAYADAGHFTAGSMGPKVAACLRFAGRAAWR